jgi:hypothetical protein
LLCGCPHPFSFKVVFVAQVARPNGFFGRRPEDFRLHNPGHRSQRVSPVELSSRGNSRACPDAREGRRICSFLLPAPTLRFFGLRVRPSGLPQRSLCTLCLRVLNAGALRALTNASCRNLFDQINSTQAPEWRNGRRGGLKIRWAQAREGSTPFSGTIVILIAAEIL